jgi:hypothetical protein
MPSKARGRKGKLGKHGASIAAYYSSYRWEFNKARRICRQLRRSWRPGKGVTDVAALQRFNDLLAVMPLSMARQLNEGAP